MSEWPELDYMVLLCVCYDVGGLCCVCCFSDVCFV
jgi:hypothetical protein